VPAIRDEGDRISFAVRVTPRAATNAVSADPSGALRVRVTAPPADGAANEAVIAVLARALDVPRSAVRIERGRTARAKTISVPASARAALLRLAK
jgi:hypothetical protein